MDLTKYSTEELELMKEVAKDIWNLCRKSPEHGNAVMDIIGEDAYNNVMRLINK